MALTLDPEVLAGLTPLLEAMQGVAPPLPDSGMIFGSLDLYDAVIKARVATSGVPIFALTSF